jgi:hypothetical protein
MAYKIKKPKVKEKEEDIFAIPKEEKAEEDTFKVEKQEAIDEISEDLYGEDIPIEIQDEDVLLVKASGKVHKISRKDLAEYQRTQAGSMSGYRTLGSIGGDWRMIDDIASDVAWTFNKLDEKLGHYKTSYTEDE